MLAFPFAGPRAAAKLAERVLTGLWVCCCGCCADLASDAKRYAEYFWK